MKIKKVRIKIMNKEVPVALVKTWIALARSNEADQEVKNHAVSMLKNSLGSNENIALYMKRHGLK